MMAGVEHPTRNKRSATIPTKASTSTTSSTGKSKRVLVYDFTEIKTCRMSRARFEREYSDAQEIATIPIPKGASKIDISPDDITPPASQEDVQHLDSQFINTSYVASVHIPAAVFWARALISPDMYPELTLVSTSSAGSSRTNSSRTNPSN